MPRVGSWQDALDDAIRDRGVVALTDIAVAEMDRETALLGDDLDLRALARSSSTANIEIVAELARGGLDLDHMTPPPQAVAFARELARRNVPMAELARAYRLGQHTLWRFGVAELRLRIADEGAVAEAIAGFTDATFATGEVLMGSALEQYAIERDRWVRSADAVRRATVQALLDGGPVDLDAASGRLRYELRRPHMAFVVWADADDLPLESAAAHIGGPGAVVVPLAAGVVAGWCSPGALDADTVAHGPRDGIHVALGTAGDGLDGFRRGHAEALEARRVAMLGQLTGTVAYADVALVALLTKDVEQARTFATRELRGLGARDEATERLATTALSVLRAQGSPRRAAQELGVHENTVAKRVRAAEQLLGHPLDVRPAELLAALLIRRAAP